MPKDFFPEDKSNEESEDDIKLIEDPNEILSSYKSLDEQIVVYMDDKFPLILPVRNKLIGEGQNIDDKNEFDKLRHLLKSRQMRNLTVGRMMWDILKDTEMMITWYDRSEEFFEHFVDDLQVVCESSFEVIKKRDTEINTLHKEIDKMEDEIETFKSEESEVKDVRKAIGVDIPPTNQEIKKLRMMFEKSYIRHITTMKSGASEQVLRASKATIYKIAGSSHSRRAYIDIWFQDAEKQTNHLAFMEKTFNMDGIEEKSSGTGSVKNSDNFSNVSPNAENAGNTSNVATALSKTDSPEPSQPVYSPASQNPTSQNPLSISGDDKLDKSDDEAEND